MKELKRFQLSSKVVVPKRRMKQIYQREREKEREERMRRLPDSNLRGIQNRGKGGDKKLL
jgi:hypothetical protein